MKKINKKYLFFFSIVVFFVSIAFISNERIALFFQKRANNYETITIGTSVIKKPENWVLYFEKTKNTTSGYLYGYFPINDAKVTSDDVVFIFKNIYNDDEIVFKELNKDLKDKAKELLSKNTPTGNNDLFEVYDFFGFKAVKIKKIKNNDFEYTISIPDLNLYVVSNNLTDLIGFKIFRIDTSS